MSSRPPNFLVIGAMKTGTTSLHAYLRTHPEIFMPRLKELDYFVAEKNWGRGWGWYLSHFAGALDESHSLGEASTNYTKFPTFRWVPERIESALPHVKLVYVVRDPLARLRSHLAHRTEETGKYIAPAEAMDDSHMRACSNYALQIRQYLQCFHRDQILLVVSERLRTEREAVLSEVFGFLDVARDFVPPNLHEELGQSHVPEEPFDMVGIAAGRLRRELGDEVRQLVPFMPEGFNGWGLLP